MYFVVSHLPQMEAQIVTEPQLCELLITVHSWFATSYSFHLSITEIFLLQGLLGWHFCFYILFYIFCTIVCYKLQLLPFNYKNLFFFADFVGLAFLSPPPFFFYNQETLENIMYIILVFCCFFKTDIVSNGQQVLHVVKHSWCCAYCSSLM